MCFANLSSLFSFDDYRSDEVELHVISLTYKDLAGLSRGEKGGDSIDKATFLQNFPVPGLVGGVCEPGHPPSRPPAAGHRRMLLKLASSGRNNNFRFSIGGVWDAL